MVFGRHDAHSESEKCNEGLKIKSKQAKKNFDQLLFNFIISPKDIFLGQNVVFISLTNHVLHTIT